MKKSLVAFLIIGAIAVTAVWADRYISGPAIELTPTSISLEPTFPSAGLDVDTTRALEYVRKIGASSIIVLVDGRLAFEAGETDQKISAHSVRKSFVGALYGIAIDRGLIDIGKTLEELGFDDVNPPLSELEKSARLEDLLTSRSGIYHPSVRDDVSDPPPPRGTHRPGEAFYYNNWSFNALGAIFEELTKMSLGDAFFEWVAIPTGMQDFSPEDVVYEESGESVYPAFRFWVSARDMARFGQLYLENGRWRGQSILSPGWIEISVQSHSTLSNGTGYGYLWRVMADGSYLARGTGGQKIRVFPETRTVLVTRVDTGSGLSRRIWWKFGKRIGDRQSLRILEYLDLP